jgi:16S rRNA (guanine966-N2)-methyltransferase
LGKLRIVGGSLRGRRIVVPDSAEVRPTSDRVRESLFNILGDEVRQSRVLDLFAGSGALGFEALSRGAASVTFLELDDAVVQQIRRTAAELEVEAQVQMIRGEFGTQAVQRRLTGPYGLVLADPPYAGDGLHRLILPALRGLLAPEGLLVLEVDRGASPPAAAGWRQVRSATYGRACLLFYRLDLPFADPG